MAEEQSNVNKSDDQPSHEKFTEESRSLYVGHLPDWVNYYDLCKAAHEFGPLELIRLVPRKKCAFLNFLNLEDAKKMMEAYSLSTSPRPDQEEDQSKVLKIMDKPVRLSWSLTRPVPDEILEEIETNGASRSLFVFYGNSSAGINHMNAPGPPNHGNRVITASELAEKFRTFGHIENIVMKPKKHIAFVNMTSLSSAINIVKTAGNEKETVTPGLLLRGRKLIVKYSTEEKSRENYAYARNDPRNQPFSYGETAGNPMGGRHVNVPLPPPIAYEPELPEGWREGIDETSGCKYYYDTNSGTSQWEHPVTGKTSIVARPSFMIPMMKPSRAVILQNLPPNVTEAMVCTLGRAHGLIESVKLLREKQTAFINFVDGQSALSLVELANQSPLHIEGYNLKIGWAKEVPLRPYLYEAIVQNGANRSIYLRDLEENVPEELIRSELESFSQGIIESIVLRPQKKPFGFVNFTDIASAKKIIDEAKRNGGTFSLSDGSQLQVSYVNQRRPGKQTTKTNGPAMRSRQWLPCRSVIISRFPESTEAKDIADIGRKFGQIESLHLNKEKNHAFINFVHPESATKFVEVGEKEGFVIEGNSLRVGFGKSVPMKADVINAMSTLGASRIIYLGGTPSTATDEAIEEEILSKIKGLVKEGEVESVVVNSQKSHAFVTMNSIQVAKRVLEMIGELEIGGEKVKLSYGKTPNNRGQMSGY